MKHIISTLQSLIIIFIVVSICLFFETSWEPRKLDWIEEADQRIRENRTSPYYDMTREPAFRIIGGKWYPVEKRLTQRESSGIMKR